MTTTNSTTKKQPPIARVRVRNVQAAIWARPTESRVYFDTSFQRSYLDADGRWQNTQTFDLSGLLALQHAIGLAIDKVLELQAQDLGDHSDDADCIDQ
jgi:hypothetical protein